MEKLTNKEKLKLVMGQDWWKTNCLDGKIENIKVSDGPMGLRCLSVTDSWENATILKAVAYPCAQMTAQTWNPEMAEKMGEAIADDCIERDVDVILGPGVNIKRTPLCGRNFEYYSEDPYVAGVFGKAFIEGVQKKHIGATLKHYCCNNREYARRFLSSEVDERTLREIYLKPFEIAAQAKPWMVMCSYNLVNGVRMSEHKKLYDQLREEYGFDGAIVSDWEAVLDPKASLHAGLDLEMPYDAAHAKQMEEYLEKGEIDQNCLDTSAERILELVRKSSEARKTRKVTTTEDDRIALAQKIEEEGIVLLKNNGVLPLAKEDKKVCVTGFAANEYCRGGGSSEVFPEKKFKPLDEALRELGWDAFYSHSVGSVTGNISGMENIRKACLDSEESDVTIYAVGTGVAAEVEAVDRNSIALTPEERDALHFLRKRAKKLVVVVYAGSVLDITEAEELADAIVLAGFGGQNVSKAVANVLTGAVNPSGKLTETWVKSIEDVPAEHTYRNESYNIYEDHLNVGYRYYESFEKEVQYPFGYGLSYTEFAYSNLAVEQEGEKVHVSFQLKNIGDREGKEVVQVYLSECTPYVHRPVRELKAFDKISLEPQEEKTVTFELEKADFAYYSTSHDAWTVDAGKFRIEIGKNVHEIVLEEKIVW